MFCTQCGHKNPANAKFCGACGQSTGVAKAPKVVEEVSVVSSQPKPSPLSKLPKFTTKTLALAGGGVVVAIVAIVLLVVGLARPMPTRADAADFMIKKSDVTDFSLKDWDGSKGLGDGRSFFGYNTECDADADSIDAAANGSTWERIGFTTKDGEPQFFSVNQIISEFDTESDVQDLLDTVRAGLADEDCDFDDGFLARDYEDQGSIKENFGVDLQGVYGYEKTDGLGDSGLIIVVRGLVVSEYHFYFDDTDTRNRKSDIEGYLTTSIERFAGIRRN